MYDVSTKQSYTHHTFPYIRCNNKKKPELMPSLQEVLDMASERGLSTGREALWPSEPRHFPDKATPSYYTKNEIFASGISK
jgi:hypothetical protein